MLESSVMISREKIEKIIWDYNLSADVFLDILNGKNERGWLNRQWALIRAVERLQYYDLLELVPFKTLSAFWPSIRENIRFTHIKNGLDYAIRKYNISAAR